MSRPLIRFPAILLICLALFALSAPLVRAADWFYATKEFGLDLIARFIAKEFYTIMSDSIVGRILVSGRDDSPAFVQDWRQFLQSGQYRGEDVFRATIADATLGDKATVCPYLRQDLANVFNAKSPVPGFNPSKYRVNALQYFKLENRCTLPSNFNVQAFQKDFRNGGWAAWGRLIEPQNNFFGLYANALDELAKQRAFEERTDEKEAETGGGYTSKRLADTGTGCAGEGPNKQCLVLGKIVTPGDIFGKSAAATIDRELDWLISSDEISEVLIDSVAFVQQKLINFADSLAADFNPVGGSKQRSSVSDETYGGGISNARATQQNISQICFDSCIATICPAPLPGCIDTDGDGLPNNRPCTPADPDPALACLATANDRCRAQCEPPDGP